MKQGVDISLIRYPPSPPYFWMCFLEQVFLDVYYQVGEIFWSGLVLLLVSSNNLLLTSFRYGQEFGAGYILSDPVTYWLVSTAARLHLGIF